MWSAEEGDEEEEEITIPVVAEAVEITEVVEAVEIREAAEAVGIREAVEAEEEAEVFISMKAMFLGQNLVETESTNKLLQGGLTEEEGEDVDNTGMANIIATTTEKTRKNRKKTLEVLGDSAEEAADEAEEDLAEEAEEEEEGRTSPTSFLFPASTLNLSATRLHNGSSR